MGMAWPKGYRLRRAYGEAPSHTRRPWLPRASGPWQCLYLKPLPHPQGRFRPTLGTAISPSCRRLGNIPAEGLRIRIEVINNTSTQLRVDNFALEEL